MVDADHGRPAARSRRRTQAERSARTRDKVVRAVVECIADEGLAATTASRIARRSGVTWGAIVHQFGDKDAVLIAALEHSLSELSATLREAPARRSRSPAALVCLLVDETWRGLTAPSFRAFLEIVLNTRNTAQSRLKARHEELVVSATREIWNDLFGSTGVAPDAIELARKLTLATLLGMAIQGMIGPRMPRFTRELEAVKANALRALGLARDLAH
jgi:AcrR family transcriptional regulator